MLHIVENKKPYTTTIIDVPDISQAILYAHQHGKTIGSKRGDQYRYNIEFLDYDKIIKYDFLVVNDNDEIVPVPNRKSPQYWSVVHTFNKKRWQDEIDRRNAIWRLKQEKKRRGRNPRGYIISANPISYAHNLRTTILDDELPPVRTKNRCAIRKNKKNWRHISKSWKDQSKRKTQWKPIMA